MKIAVQCKIKMPVHNKIFWVKPEHAGFYENFRSKDEWGSNYLGNNTIIIIQKPYAFDNWIRKWPANLTEKISNPDNDGYVNKENCHTWARKIRI